MDRNDNEESLVGGKVDGGNPTPARVSIDHHDGWLRGTKWNTVDRHGENDLHVQWMIWRFCETLPLVEPFCTDL